MLGNGSLLATLSARGEVERLFWPRIDWGQHLGELRLAVVRDGGLAWLDEEPFAAAQEYLEDTSVLRTALAGLGEQLELLDLVAPNVPVLARRIRTGGRPLRVVAYCRPELHEQARYTAGYVHPQSGALVFYRRDVALALSLTPAGDASVGRAERGGTYSVLEDAADGRLEPRAVGHRSTEGALAADVADEAVLACAFGSTPEEALARAATAQMQGFEALLDDRIRHDAERISRAHAPQDGDVETLYRRSLLVFDLLSDRETGGVIAAPEFDPDFEESGGYGFVWGRDMAYCVLAFLAGGQRDNAARGLRWLARNQAPEGLWLQRHWTDGQLAPSWTLHQVDETGAIVFAYEAAWRELRDRRLDAELWPSARRAAEFLVSFLDPETGLPRPSADLWEEREGQHAYSAAAVYGGLRAAAAMAARHERSLAPGYAAAAEGVRAGIERHLWSDELDRYLCCAWLAHKNGGPHALPPLFDHGLPYPNRRRGPACTSDDRLDVSLLGLAWPFGAVHPRSERMRATAAALREATTVEDGGMLRYPGDVYAGGNPWLLTTLWDGLYARAAGERPRHADALRYARRRQTPLGLLPEQTTRNGLPAWVLPLTWSHAMLVLAARPELALVRDELEAE